MTRLTRPAIFILAFIAFGIQANTVSLAVAANFKHTMVQLVHAFTEVSDHRIRITSGSSGKFYAQIKQGAPYHLFFSADQIKPSTLEQEGLAVQGSRFTYAIGRLVLLSRDLQVKHNIETTLLAGRYKKLAIANPRLAPYGVAASQVLTHLDIYKDAKLKWVQGENVAQSYQFVDSGNVDLGFVALSQVMQQQVKSERYWVIPSHMHQPIAQDVVLLKQAENHLGAKAFWAFIKTPAAQQLISQSGYRQDMPIERDMNP